MLEPTYLLTQPWFLKCMLTTWLQALKLKQGHGEMLRTGFLQKASLILPPEQLNQWEIFQARQQGPPKVEQR
jgi:hypothetical protein